MKPSEKKTYDSSNIKILEGLENKTSSKNKIPLEDSARKMLQLNQFKPKIKLLIKQLLGLIDKWRADSKKK